MTKLRTWVTRVLFEGEVLRLMVLAALTKPIGLITQILLANYFGAGFQYDAYVLASFLVAFMGQTMGRVFSAVAVPLTIKLKTRCSRDEVFAFQNAIYLLYSLPVAVFLAFLYARSDQVIAWVAPHAPPDTVRYTIRMVHWMALPGLAVIGIEMGKVTLNLNSRFRLPATLPVINGLATILAIITMHRKLGIWSLPLGYALSQIIQLAVAWTYAFRKRFVAPVLPSLEPGTVSRLFALSWMVFVSNGFQVINMFLDKYFATGLAKGNVSSIAYSMTIMNFGVQIFSFSLVTVVFTRMSEFLANDQTAQCDIFLRNSVRRLLRVVVPISLGLSMAGHEIVTVLFERGHFSAADSLRTSGVLSMYLLGLPAIVTNMLVTRIFQSLQRMRDKMWLSLQYMLTNAFGNMLLVNILQAKGLAISSSFAINLHLGLSLLVLHSYRTGLQPKRFASMLYRSYLLGGVTFAFYALSGMGHRFDLWVQGAGKWQVLAVGAGRFVTLVLIFWALEALLHFIRLRRHSPDRL